MNNDSACDFTFKNLAKALSENPGLLNTPGFDKAFLVHTDASDIRLEVSDNKGRETPSDAYTEGICKKKTL